MVRFNVSFFSFWLFIAFPFLSVARGLALDAQGAPLITSPCAATLFRFCLAPPRDVVEIELTQHLNVATAKQVRVCQVLASARSPELAASFACRNRPRTMTRKPGRSETSRPG